MSTRSIVEINHDYIAELMEKGHIGPVLYRWLLGHYAFKQDAKVYGVRFLGTRHHSETLKLTIE